MSMTFDHYGGRPHGAAPARGLWVGANFETLAMWKPGKQAVSRKIKKLQKLAFFGGENEASEPLCAGRMERSEERKPSVQSTLFVFRDGVKPAVAHRRGVTRRSVRAVIYGLEEAPQGPKNSRTGKGGTTYAQRNKGPAACAAG